MLFGKDYFDFHYKIATFFMMIPPKRATFKAPFWMITIPHFILICLSPFLEATKLLLGGSGDFSSDILNLGIAVLHFMGINRVMTWHFVRNGYDTAITKLRGINQDFHIFDNPLQGAEVGQADINIRNPVEKYRVQKLQETKMYCLRFFLSFFVSIAGNILLSYALNILAPAYEKFNPTLNKTSIYRDYPYPLWYPFDTSISDGYYWLGFLYQPYAFFYLMETFCCVDFLCFNSITHLTSHANIVGYAFSQVDRNIDPSLDYTEVIKLVEQRIIKCIEELQKIYACAKMLDDIFSIQILIQETCTAIVICCSIYRVTAVTLGPEAGYLSVIAVVSVVETFIVSWFSQAFTLEVLELLPGVYGLDWVNYPLRLRKTVMFLITRLQKPFYFTLGWQPIDINLFIVTVKAAYSFLTLITQSAEPK